MGSDTRDKLLVKAKELFAKNGYEGFSMRILAKATGVGLSSIYHFFEDKDEILFEIFEKERKLLGVKRAKLPARNTASEMLRDRIEHQFKNIEEVVYILKYYLHYRPNFLKLDSGYIPTKAYMHIEEVLLVGVENNEFTIKEEDIIKESKVIAHSINGFLLEYYPSKPRGKELDELVDSIHLFIMRSLTNKEVGVM